MSKEHIKSFLIAWLVILLINQIFIFSSCFAPYCLLAALPHTGALAFLWFWFAKKTNNKSRKKAVSPSNHSSTKHTTNNPTPQDHLKEKGDDYERFIGQKLEQKGHLVIYNGFIKGYEDEGVDIVSISTESKEINLVQCKNWTKMRMSLERLQEVYSRLENYSFDCLDFSDEDINPFLTSSNRQNKIASTLASTKLNLSQFNVRKTLYIASDKVIDLEIGQHLTMMSPTIFKYKGMKIVTKEY